MLIISQLGFTTPEYQKVCISVVYAWLGRITVEFFGYKLPKKAPPSIHYVILLQI